MDAVVGVKEAGLTYMKVFERDPSFHESRLAFHACLSVCTMVCTHGKL